MGLMVGRGQNPGARIQEITGGLYQAETETARKEEEIPSSPENTAPPHEKTGPTEEGLKAWPALPVKPAQTNPQPKKGASQKAEAKKPETKKSDAKQSPPKEIYNYTFQIAALRSQQEAETLKKKLGSLGLKSSIKKSGKVYLEMVQIRGGDNEISAMRKKLQTLKLGPPLLLSKKPLRSGKK